jgi:hypothetical protein
MYIKNLIILLKIFTLAKKQIDELDFDMKFETKFKENVFLKNIGSVNTYNIHP